MADHFYAEVRLQGRSAVLLITSDKQWKLVNEEPGLNFEKFAGKGGTWGQPMTMMTQWEFYRTGSTEAAFRLSNLSFPPSIVMEPRLFQNQFQVGPAWAKALGFDNGPQASLGLRAHWYPVATGALMSWIKQYCEERNAEMKSLAISLGINIAAMVDPTGGLSLVGAVEASTRGDYLGCALNLLAAIPLLGKAAQAARNTRIAVRMEQLLSEIKVLNEWLAQSKAALQRSRLAAEAGLAGVVKRVSSAATLLKNEGWIRRLDPKDWAQVGFLPKEIEVLRDFAKQGYYIVIRACNPERVEWLTWAAKTGVRTLSKPLWIKAKSLKAGGYLKGLVGYRKTVGIKLGLRTVKPPAGFDPSWIARGGGKVDAVYGIGFGSHKSVFEITDATLASQHYLVETDGFLILCDAKGAAYVSDLDVVLIQKRLQSGAFGPPGMNVGPKNIPYTGGDNAQVGMFWNKAFERVGYPPGYKAIQHGEHGGTAANFKSAGKGFEPSMHVKQQVWDPGDTWDSEQLIVAAQADNIAGVGLADNWNKINAFHRANPMGEFRFSPPPVK